MTEPSRRIHLRNERDHGRVDRLHSDLLVSIDGAEPVRCCGSSWCTGTCGLPAAVIVVAAGRETPEHECKLYGSMVAVGYVVQRWRLKWTGTRFVIPQEHAAELMKMMWW